MLERFFGGADKSKMPGEKLPGEKLPQSFPQEGETDDLAKAVGAAAIEAYESGKQAVNAAEYEKRALGKSRDSNQEAA